MHPRRADCRHQRAHWRNLVAVDHNGRSVLCIRQHVDTLLRKVRKQDELREFLRQHAGRPWWHRVRWVASLFRLVRYAHGCGQWRAALLFLMPRRAANWLAARMPEDRP